MQLSAGLRLASVGIELAVSTVVGMAFGGFLDGKFGTDPYLMIAGLLLGVVAGFRSLVATARKSFDKTPATTENPNKSADTPRSPKDD